MRKILEIVLIIERPPSKSTGSRRVITEARRGTRGREKRGARITVRLPEDLAAQVHEAADLQRRSVPAWIVTRLEAIFAKRAQRKSDK